MPQERIIRECTRSFAREGREFTTSYLLGEHDGSQGKRFFIRAALKESGGRGAEKESSTVVDLVYLAPDIGRRIYELIAGAEDPVFPVHIPDIIRDQIAATALISTRQP